MVKHKMIALIIGVLVLQMCTANPTDFEGENDVTKLFSADQLLRARDVGITDRKLIEGVSFGLTLEQMIKLHPLINTNQEFNLALANKVCTVLIPEHETASNYSRDQEMHLADIVHLTLRLPNKDHTLFIRTCLCPYLSEPLTYEMNANSFGLQFVPYTKFRFMNLKNRNASGMERVKVAKELCNIYKDLDSSSENDSLDRLSTITDLSDKEMKKFEEHWNKFETANTSKSLFENVCNFLGVKNPSSE